MRLKEKINSFIFIINNRLKSINYALKNTTPEDLYNDYRGTNVFLARICEGGWWLIRSPYKIIRGIKKLIILKIKEFNIFSDRLKKTRPEEIYEELKRDGHNTFICRLFQILWWLAQYINNAILVNKELGTKTAALSFYTLMIIVPILACVCEIIPDYYYKHFHYCPIKVG